MRVTGVVHTKNEERNIERALRSLAQVCDEILVADMQSTDRTVAIASSLGARIISVPEYGFAEPAYNEALAAVETEWVLRIDADEIVPAALADELRRIVDADSADVVSIGRANVLFGHRMIGTGWAPDDDRHFFLFKNGSLPPHLEEQGVHSLHEPLPGARVASIGASEGMWILHFNYVDWSHFVEKLNRYTSLEAEYLTRQGRSYSLGALLRGFVREIVRRGIQGKCWRDGWTGFALVWMQMTYHLLVYVKSRTRRRVGDRDEILRAYDATAGIFIGDAHWHS